MSKTIIAYYRARLSSLGYEAGLRILSLILLRNTQQGGSKVCLDDHESWTSSSSSSVVLRLTLQDPKREHRLIPILQFVHTQVYRYCFGKPADGLERSVEGEDECEWYRFDAGGRRAVCRLDAGLGTGGNRGSAEQRCRTVMYGRPVQQGID